MYKNDRVTLIAQDINEPAVYNWYDPEGNLIFTGQDITVSPSITQEYKLEVIKEDDGYKDYDDDVQVAVNSFVLGVMAPNPTQEQVTINYIAEDANSAYIALTELNSSNTYNYILNTTQNNITIDMSGFSIGVYFVTLVCDGIVIDNSTLIKQ